MRLYIALSAAFLAGCIGIAKAEQPAPDPEKQAIAAMLMESVQREAVARVRALVLQAQLDAAKAQAKPEDHEASPK